nr:MAG TPA: Putative 5'(3')-deoxyribonucleotidase [Caudoviricetes sp.]
MTAEIINFDMDGTFVNLYGVEGWLNDLTNEDTRPYEIAKPLLNLSTLARELNRLKRMGKILNVISWTSKNGSVEYNERVRIAKLKWLAKHLPSVKWDNIFIVPYGTPKHEISRGILFDDEIGNRTAWGVGAYDVDNILGVLKAVA